MTLFFWDRWVQSSIKIYVSCWFCWSNNKLSFCDLKFLRVINRWDWNDDHENRKSRDESRSDDSEINSFDVLKFWILESWILEFLILKWFISFTAAVEKKECVWWRKKKIFRWCRKSFKIKKENDCVDNFYFF